MALHPSEARRAASCAALLGSDHDGEVLNAARAFCGILQAGGLDPRTVVTAGLTRPAGRETAMAPTYHRQWQQRARMARLSPHLNEWEQGFLSDILAHGSLTQRQEGCLKAILRKSEGAPL